MSYIIREDGDRFVSPSYRDVLSAKKSSLLKQEILALSESYGGYISLHKKNPTQYEVAFSPDAGYLLGETVWHYFKRPMDLIYCEALPDTAEVILVIVKSGSVYLDGRFPADSIQEELIVFLTQQTNFEIYVYGDVPISETPQEGKLAFDSSQVKSFNVLTDSAFQQLPKLKAFQLQLVASVLKAYGIGVFPVKKVLMAGILVGLLWIGWMNLTSHKKELPKMFVSVINPFQLYVNVLTTPAPVSEIRKIENTIVSAFSIPGWVPSSLEYKDGKINISLKSLGTNTTLLLTWAKVNNFKVTIDTLGFLLITDANLPNRLPPRTISPLDDIIAKLIDRLNFVLPGNSLKVSPPVAKSQYTEAPITISFANITPATLELIGQQLNNLPLVISNVSISFSNGSLTGTIKLSAFGS
jgi:hypothetical protein